MIALSSHQAFRNKKIAKSIRLFGQARASILLGSLLCITLAACQPKQTAPAAEAAKPVVSDTVSTKSATGTSNNAPSNHPVTAVNKPIEFLQSDLITVQSQTIQDGLPLTGSLKPYNQVTVKSKVAGEILNMVVREGESVKKGQVLAQIDPLEFDLKLRQASETLSASKAQLDLAKTNLASNQALVEKNFISKNALTSFQSQYDQAKGNHDAANSALELAKKSVNDTIIKAPMSGIVAARYALPGEKVSVDGKLIDIVDLSVMELEASVPVADIGKLSLNQVVALDIEGQPQTVPGRISRIAPTTQAGSRAVLVYVRIDNPGSYKAGMFAQGNAVLSSKANALVIPASALRSDTVDGQPSYSVYAIENGLLQQKPVTIGVRTSTEGVAVVEISHGLSAGMPIVRNNYGFLSVGSPVNILVDQSGTTKPASAAIVPSTAPAVAPEVSAPGNSTKQP